MKALRLWKGLREKDLAKRAGLAQGYLSDLESGRRTGSPETLVAIAEAIEIDPAWLPPEVE